MREEKEGSNQNKGNSTADLFPEDSLKEAVDAGVFYGRKKSKTHPKMRPYILTNRGGVEIINLYKTLEKIEEICDVVKSKVSAGGTLLLVGTQPAAFQAVAKLAKEFDFPYVVSRWLGGTLTNFKIISKRIDYFKKLKANMQSGGFDKYTKKERAKIESEIEKLEEVLGGLEGMTCLPDLVLIVDSNLHMTAVKEARKVKVPVVTFANVDTNPADLDYFVVGNNKAKKSVEWFLAKIEGAVREGRNNPKPKEEKEPESGE